MVIPNQCERQLRLRKIVAFYNQKGGVGKSALATHLADLLASQAAKVLLIDWDSQGNVAPLLGLEMESGVHYWLLGQGATPVRPTTLPTAPRPGLELLLGDQMTRRAARIIQDDIKDGVLPASYLQTKLKTLAHNYDYVLIDMPPQQGEWCEAVLKVQPDAVVIPASMDNMDLFGTKTALATVQRLTPGSPIVLAPTMFHAGWNLDEFNLDVLREAYTDLVAPPLPYCALMREVRSAGLTIREPRCIINNVTCRNRLPHE